MSKGLNSIIRPPSRELPTEEAAAADEEPLFVLNDRPPTRLIYGRWFCLLHSRSGVSLSVARQRVALGKDSPASLLGDTPPTRGELFFSGRPALPLSLQGRPAVVALRGGCSDSAWEIWSDCARVRARAAKVTRHLYNSRKEFASLGHRQQLQCQEQQQQQ